MRNGIETITISDKEGFEPFYTPFDHTVILKADKNDPDIIYMEASNEEIDQQDDIIFMKALEQEAESFLRKGLISWDHLHKIMKSPEYIIGEPLDVAFKGAVTWVKAKLYKAVKLAQAVRDLLASGSTRIGASVGGYIQRRKPLTKSTSGIIKVIWDELAMTYKPVNDSVRGNVSLIPIGAFAKALMVGNGVNPAEMAGGRSMTPESLQGTVTKEIMNEFVWRLKSGDIRTEDDIRDFLEYQDAQHLYGPLAKILIKKFNKEAINA